MALTFVGSARGGTRPVGVTAGNLMIAYVSGFQPAVPSGWTQFRNDTMTNPLGGNMSSVWLMWKRAAADDPSSWNFWAANGGGPVLILAYGGASAAQPIMASANNGTASSPSGQVNRTSPAVTTNRANTTLLRFVTGGYASDPYATPAGVTLRDSFVNVDDGITIGAGDDVQAAAGTGVARFWSENEGDLNDVRIAHTVALDENQPPTAPALIQPNGGEVVNKTYQILWNAATDPNGDALTYAVDLSTDGGSTWTTLAFGFGGTQYTHDFTSVPETLTARVRVRAADSFGVSGPYDTSDANFRIQHNFAPNVPTLTYPTGNLALNRLTTNRFSWGFSDPDDGDTQSAYTVQYRLIGAPSWTQVSGQTPNQFHDFASATFAVGSYEWQVRTTDRLGLVGPFSASEFFTAATPPTGPTITTPVNGQTVNQASASLTWSVPAQTDYQARTVADDAGSPNETVVYYDSGIVANASARSHVVPFPTNSRTEHVQLRIRQDGLWTAWTSVRVVVSYTLPATPTLVVTTSTDTASITVAITHPAPAGSQPAVATTNLYARAVTTGDPHRPHTDTGTRIASAVGSTFTDRSPASGVDYEYRAEAVGTTGAIAYSAWTGASTEAPPPASGGGDTYSGY